jgi:isopenicillin N synthase-like dioxygenase
MIPVIDASSADCARRIAAACEGWGFFGLRNHGVDQDLLRAAWTDATTFFDLARSEKELVAMPRPGYPYGWSPMSGETLAKSLGRVAPPDRKESFAIGPIQPPQHSILDPDEAFAWSPNLWPDQPATMRATWSERYVAMADLSARLLSMMAESLGLADDHFAPLIDRHTSAMRALNYPGSGDTTIPTHDGQWGASAHTDYGTLTILEVDPEQAGLQVLTSSGWVDVRPEPDVLIVNLGDAMERWTNDRWKSTLHRVEIPRGRRQSIAFFHNANWDAVIECLPSCIAPGEKPRHAPIAAGPHLMQKFASTVNTI